MATLELKNVNLDYYLQAKTVSMKQAMASGVKDIFRKDKAQLLKTPVHRALKNLSLDFKDGDRVGLIGRNGAGKSTLLRVLGQIYHVTEGEFLVDGQISSLLDMNIGLNIEATGYENIVMMGVIRGRTSREMRALFTDIAAFTELGDFLDQPVRTYSTGMVLRLAFAVITAIKTDILLLDEVIGVGDQAFMNKAHARLKALVEQCKILVMSSHSIDVIRQFCNKILWLDEGVVNYFGELEEGIQRYEATLIPEPT